MINLDSNIFQCETLFLQPTWSCAKNCSGCYVKEKESKFGSEEISLQLWVKLLTQISWQKDIQVNQVTLALDTLPYDITNKSYEKMYTIAAMYKAFIRNNKKDIKYHLTVNCVNDLEQYTKSELFEGLDLVSVSNINNLDDIKRIRECVPHTKINWNVLASTFIKKSPEQIKELVRNVNQIYLLLPKAPLGELGHDYQSFWKSLFTCLNLAKEEPPTPEGTCAIPGIMQKVHVDGCINDATQFAIDGSGCSSNISRFQIWPDGRVTGCAYNSHEQYGKKAESFQDVLNNLKDARTRYEFDRCTIKNFGLVNINNSKGN